MCKSGENDSPPICADVFKPTLVLVVFFKKINKLNHKKICHFVTVTTVLEIASYGALHLNGFIV